MKPKKKSRAKKLNAFRLSSETDQLLRDAAVKSGLKKAQVVELAILRYAATFPDIAEQAAKIMVAVLLRNKKEDNSEI